MKFIEKRIVNIPDSLEECKERIISFLPNLYDDYDEEELDCIRQIKTFDELVNYLEYECIESIADIFDTYPIRDERYVEK